MFFYQITALSAAFFHLCLTVFVVTRNVRGKANRIYCLWGTSLFVWNLATYFKATVVTDAQALGWLRLLHIGLIFLPVSMFHLSLEIAHIERRRLIATLYAIHILFAASVLTPLYVAGISSANSSKFTSADLVNPSNLAVRLQARSDAVSRFLWGRLSDETRQAISESQRNPNPELRSLLLTDLNSIIEDTFVYDEQRFADVQLPPQVRDQLKPTRRHQLVHLNRLLLAAAYPAELQTLAVARAPVSETIPSTRFGPIVIGGPVFRLFSAWHTLLTLTTILILYLQQRAAPRLQRTRLRALLIAVTTLFVFGSHDFLLPHGFEFYPGTRIPVVPLGNLAAIFFGIVACYSVLQHQMLNVHVTLGRSAAQLVRAFFMLLTSFLLLMILRQFAPARALPPFAFFATVAVMSATILIGLVLFPRFFGKGEEKLERRLLGDWFEYHDKVSGFIRSIPYYTQTDQLLDDLHDLLTQVVRVHHYQIILLDESKRTFSLHRSHPHQLSVELPELTFDSPVFMLFQITHREHFSCEASEARIGETSLERRARQELRRFGPHFCFPFFSGEDPFGLLLLGAKATDEPYTRHDLQLLAQMVKNLSLVLNQIRLKNQLLLAEEMELLGTMSSGIAHDLNNLLTPVSTFLQLASEGTHAPETLSEFLPTAMRNLETMRTYVREALFFSKTQTLQLKSFVLDAVIGTCVELSQAAWREKDIHVLVQSPQEVRVEMDEILIQRLIGNLLSNAIDASPKGSQIQINLVRLTRTQTDCDWFRLRVIDRGEGISRENLKRVATPYFTTKDRGDRKRGFGLGLAICRKIVHLHGGHLVIVSEEKKGTTVQVDLPDRQVHKNHAPASLVT